MQVKDIRVRSDNYGNNFNTAVSRLLNDRELANIHPKTPDCEDGEKAKLISVSDNEIVLQSEWTPDKTFSLTKEEFYHATPWALEKDKKELIGNKKFDELENDY